MPYYGIAIITTQNLSKSLLLKDFAMKTCEKTCHTVSSYWRLASEPVSIWRWAVAGITMLCHNISVVEINTKWTHNRNCEVPTESEPFNHFTEPMNQTDAGNGCVRIFRRVSFIPVDGANIHATYFLFVLLFTLLMSRAWLTGDIAESSICKRTTWKGEFRLAMINGAFCGDNLLIPSDGNKCDN